MSAGSPSGSQAGANTSVLLVTFFSICFELSNFLPQRSSTTSTSKRCVDGILARPSLRFARLDPLRFLYSCRRLLATRSLPGTAASYRDSSFAIAGVLRRPRCHLPQLLHVLCPRMLHRRIQRPTCSLVRSPDRDLNR